MNIDNILSVHQKYGTSATDIIVRSDYSGILENVVIAPWWSHLIFEQIATKIEQVGGNVYNIYGDKFEFSFIEVKQWGAPLILERVLPLSVTKCKRIILIGSAGALNDNIKIGDLAIPKYSYNGVGACRFLNESLNDDFEFKYSGNSNLSEKLFHIIEKDFKDYKVHSVANYSIDTIFAQYNHIDHIKSLGSETIEMETSALFKCAEIMNMPATALFCISDNTITNKSLYSGRSAKDKDNYHNTRDNIVPQIIVKFFQSF